ncbi:hypothetical protein SAMN05421830_110133 [Desulfomicrobium norvegicum]|uniref:Uncharacterized protein n=1 Tax=Desulfomicrobium norvegicum (strain DSM 1741 / NCIMB 8310) TaxID=52561 RepID=A0A8G2C592_DESNO|nr:hypothetical protein [Desulfomicrobium norvegicum]SFL97799.1 hypothetical protein SAMN05421830_110133 [Desulfomicrobium norvegicum]
MSKILIIILVLLIHIHAYAFPVLQQSGTVERVFDRSIIIKNTKFSPSGYASSLPNWIIHGSEVTISYSCDELGDCYYIDIVKPNEELPLMEKINQDLLDFERIFP